MRKSIENLSGRKYTGGRLNASRTRKKYEIDRYPNEPVVGPETTITRRVRGNNQKTAIKSIDFINVNDKENKKTVKTKIIRALKNSANKDYERRGVLSKGAVVETELGSVRIVSRPGQNGTMNGILVKESN
ncbi:MAG TPA: 30S ribosomal protein S8e [Nitrososphaeraceae archaeon]|nr:30S ribosomal protein S8e [Nitrososphaeraceae archaeon]